MARKNFTVEQIIVKLREVELHCNQGKTIAEACRGLEITEQTYPHKYYEAKLLCFNRGTYMVEGKSVDEAKSNAFKWWSDFVCGFLNCP